MPAIRDKIIENARPLLEPGEQIQAVIPAQTKNGWFGALGIFWLIFVNNYRPIIVTDRRIVLTESGRWKMAQPRSIHKSIERNTKIGPGAGIWWKCTSLGEPLYIHKRFHKDVDKADALLPHS
ncbi:MAG: hypothetical protein ABI894_14120 [Ilumatobacteraceae bacterium]